jgi:hypothetical protein
MKVLDRLKRDVSIKPRKVIRATPCAAMIGLMLNCWRSNNFDQSACRDASMKLAECMKSAKTATHGGGARPTRQLNFWMKKATKGKQY